MYRVHDLINLNVESPIQRSMISLSSKKYNEMLAGLDRRENHSFNKYDLQHPQDLFDSQEPQYPLDFQEP